MKKNVILLFIFTFTIVLTLTSFKVSASSYNVNLASPDLTDKEHLSNGLYRLYNHNGITLDYNVFNGVYTLNGVTSLTANVPLIIDYDFEPLTNYTLRLYEISGNKGGTSEPRFQFRGGSIIETTVTFPFVLRGYTYTTTELTSRFLLLANVNNQLLTYTNWQFKLQLEQGSTATPYKLPMAPIRQHQELISGDLPNNFFQVLYDLMKDFIRSIAFVWIWLNDPIKIGFDLPIIGYIGITPFTPLSAFGVGILIVIGLWAVKSLVPMG